MSKNISVNLKLNFEINPLYLAVESLRCLDCTSYSSACGDTVAAGSLPYSTVPCATPYKCFTRTDAQGIIHRGCTDRFYYQPSSTTTSEVKNGENWCYCNSADSCNGNSASSCSTSTICKLATF